MLNKKEKKATIGATMTWVVAILIIFVVMMLFVYASTALALEKNIKNNLGSILVRDQKESPSMDSEQMMLALLETELKNGQVKNLVRNPNNKESDFEGLAPIFEILPAPVSGYSNMFGSPISEKNEWFFEIKDIGTVKFYPTRIKATPNLCKTSHIFFKKDKGAKLFISCN